MNIVSETDEEYEFPQDLLFDYKPNVLLVLQVCLLIRYLHSYSPAYLCRTIWDSTKWAVIVGTTSDQRHQSYLFSVDANASKSPRGIRGYSLLPEGGFISWRVQGKQGGYNQSVSYILHVYTNAYPLAVSLTTTEVC